MDPVVSLFSILGALMLGAMSPGPAFLFVTRTSVAVSRRDGLAAAAGMGLGATIICSLALIGVRAVLAQVAWLYLGFKLLGGLYLLYLAWRLWRGAGSVAAARSNGDAGHRTQGPTRTFLLALATQLSNPKAVVVIGGIFAALLPERVPGWMYAAIPPINFAMETCWYAIVALAISSSAPRSIYLRARGWIDRAAGAVLGALGLRLILESARGAG